MIRHWHLGWTALQEQTWCRNGKDTAHGGREGQREKPGVWEVEGAKDKPPRFPMVSKSPQGPALPDIKVD